MHTYGDLTRDQIFQLLMTAIAKTRTDKTIPVKMYVESILRMSIGKDSLCGGGWNNKDNEYLKDLIGDLLNGLDS